MAKKVQFDLSHSSGVNVQSEEEIGNLKSEISLYRDKFDSKYPELRKNILIWGFIGLFVSALIFGAIANSFDVFKALGIVFQGESPLLINFYEMLFLEGIAIALFVLVYQMAYVMQLKHDEYLCDIASTRVWVYETKDPAVRRERLREELHRTNLEIAKVYYRLEDFQKLEKRLAEINQLMSGEDLDKAEQQIRHLRTVKERFEQNITNAKIYENLTVITTAIYAIALVIIVAVYGLLNLTFIPGFNIPYSIIIWGAAGSIAAILYQLYKGDSKSDLETLTMKKRWLVARPAIGIIMSGVVYLAVFAGLDVLGSVPEMDAAYVNDVHMMAPFWVIAFLAGFTDRFYESIINSLLSRYSAAPDESKTGAESTELSP